MQQGEAIDIRRKSDAFGERVEEFRKFFQAKAPFTVAGPELKLEHVSTDMPESLHQHVPFKGNLQWCHGAWTLLTCF